jgi:hypothetical protein
VSLTKKRTVSTRSLPPPAGISPCRRGSGLGCGGVRGEVAGGLFQAALPIALPGDFPLKRAVEHRLDTDHEHDAPHLHPQRLLQLIEVGERPD